MSENWIQKNKVLLEKGMRVEAVDDEAIFININTSESSEIIKEFFNLYVEELIDNGIATY